MPILTLSLSPASTIQCTSSSPNPSDISGNNGSYNNKKLSNFPEKTLRLHGKVPPPRPRRIILVRHGESEGNVDESVYTRTADPKISLTEKGKAQAKECGREIRELIKRDGIEDWKVYFYVSPYKRTRETLRYLGRAFERSRIAGVREEPRLREQDFGTANFLIFPLT